MTSQFLAGVDEVGRGCLAGPVISVAIILKDTIDRSLMVDSKKLSPLRRAKLASYILEHSCSVGVGECSNHMIDKVNIHNATLESMRLAIMNLHLMPDLAYIDGIHKPDIDINSKCFIQGDNLIPEISAASIVAKVLRDNMMLRLDKILPVYGFSRHKGYGTKEHIHAIDLFGPSVYHRFTFAPIKN
ncbi:MAG: ribonuclease HII [Gammaproteobacteria bacterium]|jgi:ribonuclease HII|nr:ribonuclease HII [Gammaproteobacteria bacterium]MBT4462126.1 ribonuclease HII [Gammaproteobacteria bacterium]MBT4654985.1 ribonuclease HII [Gammaproteobacteria bacterium]MBT5116501.1 ribonuclease HII [Gammaproteobacteria bacterium]MBT5761530.1 ribonuclease HII [Gammaproteobacteria bacterium]